MVNKDGTEKNKNAGGWHCYHQGRYRDCTD